MRSWKLIKKCAVIFSVLPHKLVFFVNEDINVYINLVAAYTMNLLSILP